MKTGGETAETAIAERRVRFGRLDVAEIDAEIAQGPAGRVDEAEIVHGVGQEPADEEFEGEVIDPLVGNARGPAVHASVDDPVAQGQGGGGEPVALASGLGGLADRIGELGEDGFAQIRHGVAGCRFRGSGPARPGRRFRRGGARAGLVTPCGGGQDFVQHGLVPP